MVDDKHRVTQQAHEQMRKEIAKGARRANKQKALKRKNSNRKRG